MSRRRLLMAAGGDDDGLIFHAPLTHDLIDRVSGRELTVAKGSVTPAAGGAFFDDARLCIADLSLPVGDAPCTLAIRIAPSNFGVGGAGTGYCDFFGYGLPAEGMARLIAANLDQLCGHLYARDFDAAFAWTADGETWIHCAVAIDECGVRVYANGNLVGVSGIVPDTGAGELTIGSGLYDLSGARLSGLVKDARIYNRVLSSSEIAKLATAEA